MFQLETHFNRTIHIVKRKRTNSTTTKRQNENWIDKMTIINAHHETIFGFGWNFRFIVVLIYHLCSSPCIFRCDSTVYSLYFFFNENSFGFLKKINTFCFMCLRLSVCRVHFVISTSKFHLIVSTVNLCDHVSSSTKKKLTRKHIIFATGRQ